MLMKVPIIFSSMSKASSKPVLFTRPIALFPKVRFLRRFFCIYTLFGWFTLDSTERQDFIQLAKDSLHKRLVAREVSRKGVDT